MQIDQFLQVYSRQAESTAFSLKPILKEIANRFNITWEKGFA
jgi:hypothetical protein